MILRRKIQTALLAVLIVPLFVCPNLSKAANMASNSVSQPFFISKDYYFSGQTKINATLRVTGDKGEFFVDDDYWNTKNSFEQQDLLQQLARLSDEFDRKIYPTETNFWGSEWNPGIDHDPKIVILMANLIDTAGGYYDTGNEFSKAQAPESNEKDMIYLNIKSLRSENRINSFLSHEFQHLIAFNQKYILRQASEDIWINEMRSEYGVTLSGYNDTYNISNLKRRFNSFLDSPSDSLTEWANTAADYGQIDLFGEYLAEHFGSEVIKKTLQSNLNGIEAINQALREGNFNLNFGDVFLRWSAANVLNDTSLNSYYGYFNDGLHQDLTSSPIPSTRLIRGVSEDSIPSLTESFKDWQTKWIWVTDLSTTISKNILKVSFSGDKKQFFRGAVVLFNRNGAKEVKFFDLSDLSQSSQFFDLNSGIEKIIFIPVKMEKMADFSTQESLSDLNIFFERVATVPVPTLLVSSGSPPPSPKRPAPDNIGTGTFGLHEGDFIRAEGDIDVYIVNDFGFKRLILNPKICLMYAHLGARGCFAAVKAVSPAIRDAFKTSYFFTNGETKDGKVYFLETTGEDTAVLRYINMSGEKFIQQGGNFSSIFLFNTREKKTYPKGTDLFNLP